MKGYQWDGWRKISGQRSGVENGNQMKAQSDVETPVSGRDGEWWVAV